MTFYTFLYKAARKVRARLAHRLDHVRTALRFAGNGVKHHGFRTNGVPHVDIARGGGMSIGKGFRMNNGVKGNPIGCFEPCSFVAGPGANIRIGENVGISQSALIAQGADIVIEANVKIGGGSSFYTTDFHSLDARVRASGQDLAQRVCRPIRICEGAFIGAHAIILKGVTVGEGSIVGAGNVVTKSIPAGEIHAGNPARFIRKA